MATNDHGLLFTRVSSLKVLNRILDETCQGLRRERMKPLVANGMYNQPKGGMKNGDYETRAFDK